MDGSRSLSSRSEPLPPCLDAVISVASRSITSQPASSFPAMASHGNPAGACSISVHTCARALARAQAIRSSMPAAPARSRARRIVGLLGASPSTGARCASTAISLMLVAPSAIAAAIDTSTTPRVQQRRPARLPHRRAQPRGKPCLVGGLAEQDRAGVADQARPAAGHLQGMIPPRILHGRRALQSPGSCNGCGDLQSPRTRALFALKPARTPAPRAPAPIRCTRTQPAAARNPSSQRQRIPGPLNCQSALNSGG